MKLSIRAGEILAASTTSSALVSRSPFSRIAVLSS